LPLAKYQIAALLEREFVATAQQCRRHVSGALTGPTDIDRLSAPENTGDPAPGG